LLLLLLLLLFDTAVVVPVPVVVVEDDVWVVIPTAFMGFVASTTEGFVVSFWDGFFLLDRNQTPVVAATTTAMETVVANIGTNGLELAESMTNDESYLAIHGP
jgi:hypothetical protein